MLQRQAREGLLAEQICGKGPEGVIAQTNIQLYNQLPRDGYRGPALAQIRRAYELALEIFAGRCQPSGKCFLSHVVGTASVLSSLGQSADVVAAGLLHNVYHNGDFGDGSTGATPAKRIWVQRAVGPVTEEIVYRFAVKDWSHEALRAHGSNLEPLEDVDRQVLMVFLANELERFADGGIFYQRDCAGRLRFVSQLREVSVRMAEALGVPQLAEALRAAFRQATEREISSPVLRMARTTPGSYVCAPRSFRMGCRT